MIVFEGDRLSGICWMACLADGGCCCTPPLENVVRLAVQTCGDSAGILMVEYLNASEMLPDQDIVDLLGWPISKVQRLRRKLTKVGVITKNPEVS